MRKQQINLAIDRTTGAEYNSPNRQIVQDIDLWVRIAGMV
jgi:hypothetical protein